jgi:alanyl-tRNA synthetase
MTSAEIRDTFLRFFADRDHRVVRSSPLVLPNDPTLLFANAGMNQFKDVFTGREPTDFRRAASVQKCLRVSGKHNDLETVGRTPRHHTFFEMLGNFSFGDYFKDLAIVYAWELVTQSFGIPPDSLWVTVFGGTESLPADDEALRVWREKIGVEPRRILGLDESENFWRMGDTGPCGPSSEIHVDLGADLTSVEGESTPANDPRRFLEIWNLVFMQFDQQEDGGLTPLPAPSIDTGMGLERIASVLQGTRSNYDIDLFEPILRAAADRAGVEYGADPEQDFSLRVIADHARAFCALVGDGVVPSNDRRGFVLRRLLRRAIRHGRKLGINEPFLQEVTPAVIESLGTNYPEIVAARQAILDIGGSEERRFAETLATGLAILERSLAKLPDREEADPVLPGKELFQLHDTFGFPLDLARDIAEERGVILDEAGFEAEMTRQRERARASWKQGRREEAAPALAEFADRHPTTFEGYSLTELDEIPVLALLRDGQPIDRLKAGELGEVVLEATPFYAEAGGQVGDTGELHAPSGAARVLDVQRPVGQLIVHRVEVDRGELSSGDRVRAEVDGTRRSAIRRNHTATHLLHAALREVIGPHVKQAGSLVAPDRLRFDFSHFASVSPQAQDEIEALVNDEILNNSPVATSEMELEEALKQGAMALFGEKYGGRVRVVRIGDFSLELCGGTHVERTGEIGLVKLTQEHGIASGTRRVEAISGDGALDRFREEHGIVRTLEEQLSVPRDQLVEEIGRRLDQGRELQRALDRQKLDDVRSRLLAEVDSAPRVGGVGVVAERADGLEPQEMRELADNLRRKLGSGVVVLGRAEADKASLLVAVTKDLTGRVPAGELVRELGKIIGGGGGGRPDLAEAGGKQPARLDEALGAAVDSVAKRLETSD